MYNSVRLRKMRVIGGFAKGVRLQGSVHPKARPTSELVRGAIFNILGDIKGGRALDLFAGTGSLGIEALSRGIELVDFVEQNSRQCAVIHGNLLATGFSDKGRVHQMSVQKALENLPNTYDLMLMDPPYNLKTLNDFLEDLGHSHLLQEGTITVVGHSKRQPLEERYGPICHVNTYKYGDSVVDIFRCGDK